MAPGSLKDALIAGFLKQFKAKMTSGQLEFVPRKENLDGMARLGLRIEDTESIILSLTDQDYMKGPEADLDGSRGEVWFFHVFHSGCEVYIKLKLDGDFPICISFHPSRYPKKS